MVPNDDEPVRFEQDIQPLFRPRDQQSMKSHFDLWADADVSGDGRIGGDGALLLASDELHRAQETCRIAGGEQLFRIGATAGCAGGRQLDVEPSVRGA